MRHDNEHDLTPSQLNWIWCNTIKLDSLKAILSSLGDFIYQ